MRSHFRSLTQSTRIDIPRQRPWILKNKGLVLCQVWTFVISPTTVINDTDWEQIYLANVMVIKRVFPKKGYRTEENRKFLCVLKEQLNKKGRNISKTLNLRTGRLEISLTRAAWDYDLKGLFPKEEILEYHKM